MLAERWRRQLMLERRAQEFHRACYEGYLARGRVLELDPHAARYDLGLLEHLPEIVDRTIRHAGRLQRITPFARRALQKYFGEQPRDRVAVLDPPRVGGKPRILGEVLTAGDVAELAEQVVVAAGKDDIAVLRFERLVRHDVRVRVADAPRDLPGRQVVHALVGEDADLGVEKREIQVLARPAALPVRQGGANGDRRVHAGHDVRDRDAYPLRAAAGHIVALAGYAHD